MSTNDHTKFTNANLFNVEGWTVLVTGGPTGIGLMIAQGFANNGARVYIAGRRTDALIKTAETWGSSLANPKGKLIPVTVDITSKESIQMLVNEIKSAENKLDVLVNNAGVSLGTSNTDAGEESADALQEALWKESWDNWEATYRTNVIG
jgi:NADP-dependent 3-hydroxy acid dehydrogenase YdfG